MSRVRANNFTDKAGTGAPTLPYGVTVTGVSTIGNVVVGGATTDVVINGDLRVTGIITTGTASITIDPDNEQIVVGSALTLGHTQGVQFHTQSLHSDGFDVNNINASGIVTAANVSVGNSITATTFYGSGANLDGIDSTAITNGTSNVTVSENANINVVRSGTTRLSINEAGIDVTGEAVVDGIHIGSGKIRGDSSNHVFIQGGNACTVYVSDSGNDSTGTGESNSPVRTINRAVELLPKVMGNQTFTIRIQGSSYTTTSNQMVRGFSFNGSNDVSRFIEICGDTQTVTFNLRHGLEFFNVHGFRMTSINFVVESGYSGWLRFLSCSEGRVYSSCSFTTNSTSGWSERIGFYNSRKLTWEANITATSSASAGLGGLVVISDKSQIDMGGTMTKSGTLFNNTGIAVVNGAELRGGVDVNNFRDGIYFGVNHYNAETGGTGMLNGVTVSNCTTGIKLWNNSFVRKYSVQYSGNGTNETIGSTNGGNFT